MLVVDRDAKYREWLRMHLGIVCPDAAIGAIDLTEFEPWSALVTGRECDVLLLAASFGTSPEDPEAHGLDLLRKLRARNVASAVIALADDGNELTAVRALQLGAADYLPKRLLTPDRLKTSVRVALRRIEQRVARRLADLAHTAQSDRARCARSSRQAAKPADAAAAAAPPAPDSDIATGHPRLCDREEDRRVGKSRGLSGREHRTRHGCRVESQQDLTRRNAERQALEREYKAILAIRHPAVVTIHDYGIEGGLEYLAMEYFPRGDLKARMYFGVTEAETLRYVEQIAAALQRRARRGSAASRPEAAQRHAARKRRDRAHRFRAGAHARWRRHSTRTGVLRGSPYYMSPEQALGEELDARSDLYSLGVIYHEMLTGKKPFTGGSAMEVLQQHVNAPPPQLPLSLSRHMPVIARLLAKRREDRFNTADEVIEATAALRQGSAPQVQSTAA